MQVASVLVFYVFIYLKAALLLFVGPDLMKFIRLCGTFTYIKRNWSVTILFIAQR